MHSRRPQDSHRPTAGRPGCVSHRPVTATSFVDTACTLSGGIGENARRMRKRIMALAGTAVLALALAGCSKGGGTFVLHGTIRYQATVGCAGSLANALITVSGNSGVVGSGNPVSVNGQTCAQSALYSIPVQRSSSYAVSIRLSGAVSYSFGPYPFDRLEGTGFRLDISVLGGKPTTSPPAG